MFCIYMMIKLSVYENEIVNNINEWETVFRTSMLLKADYLLFYPKQKELNDSLSLYGGKSFNFQNLMLYYRFINVTY
jgi:hypothetical protein